VYQKGRDVSWGECTSDVSSVVRTKTLNLIKAKRGAENCPEVKVLARVCHRRSNNDSNNDGGGNNGNNDDQEEGERKRNRKKKNKEEEAKGTKWVWKLKMQYEAFSQSANANAKNATVADVANACNINSNASAKRGSAGGDPRKTTKGTIVP